MISNNLTIEIEQCLLGCLFRNNAAAISVMEEGLNENDFICAEHWLLLERAIELFTHAGAFNVADMNSVMGEFPQGMDAPLYARECVDAALYYTSDQVRSYARTIKENARKRRISEVLKETEAILPTRSSEEVLAYLGSKITDNAVSTCNLKNGSIIFDEILSEFDLPPQSWSTGLPLLDRCMAGGLYAGFTYGFAGKEKSGKTTLAHTISFNLDLARCPHLYVALEMGSKEIECRNIARRIGANSIGFRNSNADFKARVKSAARSQHIFYLDAPGSILQEILYEIGISRIRHGIKGFIVDYWQLVEGRERGDTEEQHIRRVAQGLANYAKKHGLWCVMLAQQNKEGDLFGGGGLKKACEQLYFIETPHDQEDMRWLRMAASRYTPLCDVGTTSRPALILNDKAGPHFESLE